MSEAQPVRLYPEYQTLPEYQPKTCPECEAVAQTVYWRTFTQTSLDTFRQNGFHSPIQNFQDYSRRINNDNAVVVPPDILNTPGNLWCSPDPAFALSMGLTRGIIENTPVYLLGFNYCMHDEDEGAVGYRVFDNTILKPLNHSEIDRNVFFSQGTLFNKLNPNQIETGVFFPLDPTLLHNLRAITKSVISDGNLTIYDISQAMNTAFTYLEFDYKYFESSDPYLFTDIYLTTLLMPNSDEASHRVNQEVLQRQFLQELHNKILLKTKKSIINQVPRGFRHKINEQIEHLLSEEDNNLDITETKKLNDLRELLKLHEFYSYDFSPESSISIAEKCIQAGIDIIPWLEMVRNRE